MIELARGRLRKATFRGEDQTDLAVACATRWARRRRRRRGRGSTSCSTGSANCRSRSVEQRLFAVRAAAIEAAVLAVAAGTSRPAPRSGGGWTRTSSWSAAASTATPGRRWSGTVSHPSRDQDPAPARPIPTTRPAAAARISRTRWLLTTVEDRAVGEAAWTSSGSRCETWHVGSGQRQKKQKSAVRETGARASRGRSRWSSSNSPVSM